MSKKSNKYEIEYNDPNDEILSLFIKDQSGNIVGESIGIDDDKLIVKSGENFYILPLNSIKISDHELHLIKDVDWSKALKEGEKWRSKELDLLWGVRRENDGEGI